MLDKERILGKIGDMEACFREIKKTWVEYFQQHTEIEVAYIFGSMARGKTNALSDIDIAVLVDSLQSKINKYRDFKHLIKPNLKTGA